MLRPSGVLVGQAGQLRGVGQFGRRRCRRPARTRWPGGLPRVMVPVLSSSSVFTSPAASTRGRTWPAVALAPAGPCRRCRSRTAARRSWSGSARPAARPAPRCPARRRSKIAIGWRVTTASRKMIVNEASRMFSAISFGVFCRERPSTSAIIRSNERLARLGGDPHDDPVPTATFVPPVTALRSPPDSGSPARTHR